MKRLFFISLLAYACMTAVSAQTIDVGLSGGCALYSDSVGLTVSPSCLWRFPTIMNMIHPAAGAKFRYARLASDGHTENEFDALAVAAADWYPVERFSLIASLGIGGGYISDSTSDGTTKMTAFTIEPGFGVGYDIGNFRILATAAPSIDLTKSGMKSCAILEAGLVYRFNNGGKK